MISMDEFERRAKIKQLQADPAFLDRHNPRHMIVLSEYTKLHGIDSRVLQAGITFEEASMALHRYHEMVEAGELPEETPLTLEDIQGYVNNVRLDRHEQRMAMREEIKKELQGKGGEDAYNKV